MITIQMGCPSPVACSPGCIGSIAYNGSEFVLLDPRCCGVIKLDGSLCPLETVHTAQKYSTICYDPREDCYWATAEEESSFILRLDLCFQETGRMKIYGGCWRRPCGISCDPCGGALWLVFPSSIERINKTNGVCVRQMVPSRDQQSGSYPWPARLNLGLVALCGGRMISFLEEGKQYLEVECPGCGARAEVAVPRDSFLEAMVLRGMSHCGQCTNYQVRLILSSRCSRELFTTDCLVTCCDGERPPCPPPPPPPPHPHPHPCSINEVIHSVALEEAGIAHILNAEGEKIQKAVAMSDNVNDLLCVNESVRKTITQITILEGQLYSKLEAVTGCICDKPEPPPKPCD